MLLQDQAMTVRSQERRRPVEMEEDLVGWGALIYLVVEVRLTLPSPRVKIS